MLRIRVDDVMTTSRAFSKEKAEARFETIHGWIVDGNAIHVPTILVKDIQEFPNTIELLKEETKNFKLFPEIHGYEHIDYSKLTEEEILKHLKLCLEWFQDVLKIHPTIWATPWGSKGNLPMKDAARKLGLKIEGVENTIPPKLALELLEQYPVSALPTVMTHWWEKGLSLKKICQFIKK